MVYKKIILTFFLLMNINTNAHMFWCMTKPLFFLFTGTFYCMRSLGDYLMPATRTDLINLESTVNLKIADEFSQTKVDVCNYINLLYQTTQNGLVEIDKKIEINKETVLSLLQSVKKVKEENRAAIFSYNRELSEQLRKQLSSFIASYMRNSQKSFTELDLEHKKKHTLLQEQLKKIEDNIELLQKNNQKTIKEAHNLIAQYKKEQDESIEAKQKSMKENKEKFKVRCENNNRQIALLQELVGNLRKKYLHPHKKSQDIATHPTIKSGSAHYALSSS